MGITYWRPIGTVPQMHTAKECGEDKDDGYHILEAKTNQPPRCTLQKNAGERKYKTRTRMLVGLRVPRPRKSGLPACKSRPPRRTTTGPEQRKAESQEPRDEVKQSALMKLKEERKRERERDRERERAIHMRSLRLIKRRT